MGITTLGSGAFYRCNSLLEINVPDENSIWVYSRASGWEDSKVNSNVNFTVFTSGLAFTYIVETDSYSVSKGTSTGSDIYIPAMYNGKLVTTIGDFAFFFSSNIRYITIPNSVTSIGNSAFWGCSKLQRIVIPNSVTSLGPGVFAYCNELFSVSLPDSITSIDWLFSYCYNLLFVNIPDSVTNISATAFQYCRELTTITIPSSVTIIGAEAFLGCEKLTIYTDVASKPAGWNLNWNPDNRPVVWG